MPKLLILSAEEKSYRRIVDGQTITVDGGAGTATLNRGWILLGIVWRYWHLPIGLLGGLIEYRRKT